MIRAYTSVVTNRLTHVTAILLCLVAHSIALELLPFETFGSLVTQIQTHCSNPECKNKVLPGEDPGPRKLDPDNKICPRCTTVTDYGNYFDSLKLGDAKAKSGSRREAADAFISAATRRVSNERKSVALSHAGIALLDLNAFDDAEKELEKSVRLDASNAEGQLGYGRVALQKSDFAAAESRFLEANRLMNDDSYAAYYLATCQFKQRKYSEARKYFEIAEPKNLDNYDVAYQFALCLIELKNEKEAEPRLVRAAMLRPTEFDPVIKLADMFARSGRHENAATMWGKAADLKPNVADYSIKQGFELIEAKQFDQAERAFLRALGREPGNFDALTNLGGILLVHKRDPLGAQGYFERALKVRPDSVITELMVSTCADLRDSRADITMVTGTGENRQLAWHPGGRRIAFQSTRDKKKNIYISGSDGVIARITQDGENGGAVWSPDGTKVAYHSERNKNMDLYIYDVKAKRETRFTTDSAEEEAPTWSPDGKWIAYHRKSGSKGKWDIYLTSSISLKAVQVTTSSSDEEFPRWSPDGRTILFVSDRSGAHKLYTMPIDAESLASGKSPKDPPAKRLTQTAEKEHEGSGTWSPDSARVAFCIERNKSWQLHSILVGGAVARKLGEVVKGDEIEPAWSPTGARIATTVFSETREVTGRDSYGNPTFGPAKKAYRVRSILVPRQP